MYYVLDENNNKIEAFDKEGVVAAIEEAAKNGTLENLVADSGFIKKLKCSVTGGTNQVAFITNAKYNNLESVGLLKENTAYFIVDDPTLDNIDKDLDELVDKVNGILNGTRAVPKATNVTEQINGKNIADIFKNDGTTVKNAANLKNVENYKGAYDSGFVAEVYEGIWVVAIMCDPPNTINNNIPWVESTIIVVPDISNNEAWMAGASNIKYSGGCIYVPKDDGIKRQVKVYRIGDITDLW